MRISDWSSDVCSSDLLVRSGSQIANREAWTGRAEGEDGGTGGADGGGRSRRSDGNAEPAGGEQRLQRRDDPGTDRRFPEVRRRSGGAGRHDPRQRAPLPGRRRPEVDTVEPHPGGRGEPERLEANDGTDPQHGSPPWRGSEGDDGG